MGVRKYKNVRRVYFDMDGVIADFEKACIDGGHEFKDFKMLKGSYLNLPVYEGATEAVNMAIDLGYEIFALTKIPAHNPYSATEKLIWIANNMPQFKDHVILSPDKGVIGKAEDILIDDHPEWANADQFPGRIVKFTGDWTAVKKVLLELAPDEAKKAVLKEMLTDLGVLENDGTLKKNYQ